MQALVKASQLQGSVQAPPAKAIAHRYLICASLADQPGEIVCPANSADIAATAACLQALGARISYDGTLFRVLPLDAACPASGGVLPCGESGSTLRFLLPLACALGAESSFALAGRLPERPMAPLYTALTAGGISINGQGSPLITCSGRLRAGHYQLPGDISSQFISGLLLALPLLRGNSSLSVGGEMQSRGYLELTRDAISRFGLCLPPLGGKMEISGGQQYRSPGRLVVEGDWSAAAFWLAAIAISGCPLRILGLERASLQGDRAAYAVLERMGLRLDWRGDALLAAPGDLCATEIDAADIPDLVPPLAAVAAFAKGETRIVNAARLRLKESDRLAAVAATLAALGADISEQEDSLLIRGKARLAGGDVSSCNDHRIAMMAAIAALGCAAPVRIKSAQAINKSYPRFFADLSALGGDVQVEER
ncbi:MAG: 3-phosphoshikimate 1-carboxyvinyltransferase [Clostridia bacterium]|nr:3-phosphoshikimate 1-carboxyvinyltransferase [Clostridia bacterium]